eukprot:Pgem_evm1s9934
MHWHSHAVESIAFTSDGEYLISGGMESVLVIWQLQTGNKNFLPRLGGEILSLSISPNEKLFAVSLGDNSVKLVTSATLQVVKTVRGLTLAGPTSEDKYP